MELCVGKKYKNDNDDIALIQRIDAISKVVYYFVYPSDFNKKPYMSYSAINTFKRQYDYECAE